jgi:hypothetical protein
VAEASPTNTQRPARAGERVPLKRLAVLFVLSGFAIAQPLLDVTGRSPETFLFYRVDGPELVGYVLILVLVPPIVLWLLVHAVGRASAWAGRVLHAIFAGGLVALIAIQAAKKLADVRGVPLVVVAVLVGAAGVVLFARSALVRSFVTVLTPAPIVFALLFLLASPSAELVRPAGDVTTAREAAAGAKPPVVVIFLDEFPLVSLLNSRGEVDGRLYPNFAAVAADSDWYRNATGVASFTPWALPAMLTGRYPETEAVPSYLGHPDNLFSLLSADYRIRPFETITQMCDPAICDDAGLPRSDTGLRGLFGQTLRVAKDIAGPYESKTKISDQFVEESAAQRKEARAKARADGRTSEKTNWKRLKDNQPERFQRFVAGLQKADKPTLHFLHLLLPHAPWRYLPSGATYPDKVIGGVRRKWGKHPYPLQVNRQRHLLQLGYTDRLLGEVVDRLKREGIWDEALVVVTADHGESYIPGKSGRRLVQKPQDEAQIAWVPMFLKHPSQSRGTVSDANWEQVDLLPTMADALDVEVPFKVDGISQLSESRKRTDKYFYNDPGQRMTFPGGPAFDVVLNGVTDTVVRGAAGQEGFYEIGPRRDWIGKSVAGLAGLGVDINGPASDMSAKFDPAIDFDRVDPGSGSVPALISGTLTQSSANESVAIVVNGTVAIVSEVWPEQGKPTFAGMAQEALFRAGKNDVALYEVVGGASPQLRPIAVRR